MLARGGLAAPVSLDLSPRGLTRPAVSRHRLLAAVPPHSSRLPAAGSSRSKSSAGLGRQGVSAKAVLVTVAAAALARCATASRRRTRRCLPRRSRGRTALEAAAGGADGHDPGGPGSDEQLPQNDAAAGSDSFRDFENDDVEAAYRLAFGDEQDASQLDTLAPGELEYLNPDVPNHFLEIYRSRVSKNVIPGPRHQKGRSAASWKKVAYRLKQGPPLAHNNWAFPSRLRVSTGIARRRRLEKPAIPIRPTMSKVRKAIFNQVRAMHLWSDHSVRVLDLFSGTGSLGIEALSSGATECIYVDSAKECVDCCIANSWLSGFMDHEEAAKGALNERSRAETEPLMMVGGPRASVQIELHKAQVARQPVGGILADVMDVLKDPAAHGLVDRKFNLVLVSPPYNEISYRQLCTALASSDLIERDGLVAIQYPKELGCLPPVLNAAFEDLEDQEFDDISMGVPTLYGLRNRRYGTTMVAIYSKLPTGARGRVAEPRPYEFTETHVPRKLVQKTRAMWQTASLFTDRHERGFAKPKPKPALNAGAEE